ncbi:hypothetical protein TrVE_jg342 [Triparma verrucosa]|uniref:TATA-binding protein interacting (TIP20) domain-containing protein n=1 Tax=Triparma verrucosa TaxID=1606542 RepID=A0A9W7C5M0_9STRA|nr:hypothetical protein TrVE_jg342 [Triparma verrucosa]
MPSSRDISRLLEKAGDFDKDERYMAVSDVCNLLSSTDSNSAALDSSLERRVCAAILQRLDDTSNDVQSVAVKCLAVLLVRVREESVMTICDKLCEMVIKGKEELRDVYGIGLKKLIQSVPNALGANVGARLVQRLLGGVQQDNEAGVKSECLECLECLLARFGGKAGMAAFHEQLISITLTQLTSKSASSTIFIKKKSTACIATLAVVVSDPLLFRLVETLIRQVKDGTVSEETNTIVKCICKISSKVGFRLGKQLPKILPLFMKFTNPASAESNENSDSEDENEDSSNTDKLNELRESCFSGFNSFVSRCPTEIQEFLPEIVKICLAWMKYDPNYSYDDSDDEGSDNDSDEEDYDDDYSDDGNDTGDDDSSWKVRAAAVGALVAVIDLLRSSPSLLWDAGVVDQLLSRFKEREENVRHSVILSFTQLIKNSISSAGVAVKRIKREDDMEEESKFDSPVFMLETLGRKTAGIIKNSEKQLKVKKGNEKSKTAALALLGEMCSSPNGLGDVAQIEAIMSTVALSLASTAPKSLKLDALMFLQTAFQCTNHPPSSIQPHIMPLLPLISNAVGEDWYKIIVEALRVLSTIPSLLVTAVDEDAMTDGPPPPPANVDIPNCANLLYSAIEPRLNENDIDQEIKETAIVAIGRVISTLGNHLPNEAVEKTLTTLTERMGNEITRASALKTLGSIASSPLKIDMSPVLEVATEEMTHFLRQHSRSLKMCVLETISAFVQSNNSKMNPKLFELILTEAAPLVTDADLQVSHLAISVSYDVLASSSDSVATIQQSTMPALLKLIASPLLQGLALSSATKFLEELSLKGSGVVSFEEILKSLHNIVDEETKAQALSNTSKCLAAVVAVASESQRNGVIKSLVGDIEGGSGTSRTVGLLTLGALGERVDLSSVDKLGEVLLAAFESDDDQTKSAASFALGHVSVRAVDCFLPIILSALEGGNKTYLVLSSLKELIVSHLANDLELDDSNMSKILPLLINYCSNEDEGVRSMVAECLGCFVTMNLNFIIPTLKGLASEKKQAMTEADNLTLWTVATSVKNALSSKSKNRDGLTEHLPVFLEFLESEDFPVRAATLLMINAAVHYQPQVILGCMKEVVMPKLLEFLELKSVRVIDLGPFKHKIDDALPLRKTSLAILDSALTQCPYILNISEVLLKLAAGFKDTENVVATHQLIIRFSQAYPAMVAQNVSLYIDSGLQKTLNKKFKESATAQDIEKINELIRSGLRVVIAFKQLETDKNFEAFFDANVTGKDNVRILYEELVGQ